MPFQPLTPEQRASLDNIIPGGDAHPSIDAAMADPKFPALVQTFLYGTPSDADDLRLYAVVKEMAAFARAGAWAKLMPGLDKVDISRLKRIHSVIGHLILEAFEASRP